MDAHHKDGKEFITIYLKFLHKIKMSEEKLFAELYPEYGNFETAKIVYQMAKQVGSLKTRQKILETHGLNFILKIETMN